jgi:hypothetical protein
MVSRDSVPIFFAGAQRRTRRSSSVGPHSLASSTTGVSVYRTMQPSAPCAGSLSGANRGCSQAPTAAGDMYSLIVTAKMNDIDPQAWLADTPSAHQNPREDPRTHRRSSSPSAKRPSAMELASRRHSHQPGSLTATAIA